jgi:transposase-like protein
VTDSSEFKLESVKLAERGEAPIRQVARDLGISENLLRKWIKQFGKRSNGSRFACAITGVQTHPPTQTRRQALQIISAMAQSSDP